jgi:type II secretory pathway pseudopilin PulG
VVIGIIAILAGVALGPITRGIKQAQESTAVQVAHQVGVLEFAYSNDYSQTYPYDAATKAENIALALLQGGYANNPSLFYVAGTPGAIKYTGSAPYTNPAFAPANCNWDFWQQTGGGLTSAANDLTPLCQLQTGTGTGITGLPTTAGTGQTLTINPANTAFGADGIAVYYKGNNAVFVKCLQQSSTTATNVATSPVPYCGPSYSDPLAGSYKSIVP